MLSSCASDPNQETDIKAHDSEIFMFALDFIYCRYYTKSLICAELLKNPNLNINLDDYLDLFLSVALPPYQAVYPTFYSSKWRSGVCPLSPYCSLPRA